GLVEESCAVEVVEVVQRVGDVVGDVHDRALDTLLAWFDQGVRGCRLQGILLIDRVVVELARASAALAALAAAPRILEHGGAHGGGEVEADAGTVVLIEAGEDAIGLRIALEALAQPEAGA